MKSRERIGRVLLLAVLLLAVALLQAPGAEAQTTAADCYRMPGGDKWVCRSGGEMEFQTGAVLDVQSGATFTAASSSLGAASATTLSTSGAASLQTMGLAQTSQQTVVANSVISVTAGIAVVTASSPVTVGNIYTGTNGQILVVVNAGTNAITIPDSGLNRLSGALALGQYDTATLVWYSGAWTQLATSNN